MKLPSVVAIAIAEIRSCIRLVRTWLFVVLAFLISIFMVVAQMFNHGMMSHTSSFLWWQGPKYIVGSSAGMALMLFMFGAMFLIFDIRARDNRERIDEVLGSTPVSNFELILGRIVGVTLIVWITAIVIAAVSWAIGFTATVQEIGMGDTPEMYSTISLVTHDFVPFVLMWCALLALVTTIVRLRILVVAVGIALIVAFVMMGLRTPVAYADMVSNLATVLPSDVDHSAGSLTAWLQRGADLIVFVAFAMTAAALYSRVDTIPRLRRLSYGGALLVGGVAAYFGIYTYLSTQEDAVDRWRSAHASLATAPRVDLTRIAGDVVIEPGSDLALDLRVGFKPDAASAQGPVSFSFNPDLEVSSLRLNGEEIDDFTHENGVLQLEVQQPLTVGEEAEMVIQASGVPNGRFAYLDSEIDPYRATQSQAFIFMGWKGSIFSNNYVALMPAARWYPVPGANWHSPETGQYDNDFFHIDLSVSIPTGWIVAGPSRENGESADDGTTTFLFKPTAPLSKVALLASEFAQHSAEIEGVDVELLMAKHHSRNVEQFADAAEPLQERIAGRLRYLAEIGLPYPYSTLSFVEIPSPLRVYGGGWLMDSVMSMPGVLMHRESGFATAHFSSAFDWFKERNDSETELAERKVGKLNAYFSNDVEGGNPMAGALRNVLQFQTGAVGPESTAINFVLNSLVQQLTRTDSFSSPHLVSSQADLMEATSALRMTGGATANRRAQMFRATISNLRNSYVRRPSTWEGLQSTPLMELDGVADPRAAFNILVLKGRALASVLFDSLGSDRVGDWLSELRNRYSGRGFTEDELYQVAKDVGVDLDSLVGNWLEGTELPGFLVSSAMVQRLEDDERGEPQFEFAVHVHNSESTPGVGRLAYNMPAAKSDKREWARRFDQTDAFTIAPNSTVEVSLVLPEVPEDATFRPYLSLNRTPVAISVPEFDERASVASKPKPFIQPSDWTPQPDPGIVIDDLDHGFIVSLNKPNENVPGIMRFFFSSMMGEAEFDEGLPESGMRSFASWAWTRSQEPRAWGRYRHTMARSQSSVDVVEASFTAELPHPGNWQLQYHLPYTVDDLKDRRNRGSMGRGVAFSFSFGRDTFGIYRLMLRGDSIDETIEFNADLAKPDWNAVGSFDLDADEVTVVIPNLVDGGGSLVIADAIRWMPVLGS